MTARLMKRAVVIASVASLTNAVVLTAQPSTERLADVSDARGAKIGVDVGGTFGPLSLFQQVSETGRGREQAVALSYIVGEHARHTVRAVAWLYQAERLRQFEIGMPPASRQRTTERFALVGASVDMFDKPLGGKGARAVRVVGALGGGVIPYASRRSEYTGVYQADDRSKGAGIHATGSVGLRWRRLVLDQQLFLLLSAGGPLFDNTAVAPLTMGVRF